MDPSTLIVGALIIGFVFYVTAKGELPQYLGIFYGTTQQTAQATSAAAASATGIPAGAFGVGGLAAVGGIVDNTVGGSVANSDLTDVSTPLAGSGSVGEAVAGSDITSFFDC